MKLILILNVGTKYKMGFGSMKYLHTTDVADAEGFDVEEGVDFGTSTPGWS